jgi:hypothetical protein
VGQDEASGFAHDYPATDEVTPPAACGLDRQGTLEAFGASSRSVDIEQTMVEIEQSRPVRPLPEAV